VDWGGSEIALALDLRGDGQIVAAGCADGKFAWAQLPTNTQVYTPLKGTTDFPGGDECATGVKFAGANRVVAAGYQTWEADANFAIARFETTVDSTVPMWRLLLPLIRR